MSVWLQAPPTFEERRDGGEVGGQMVCYTDYDTFTSSFQWTIRSVNSAAQKKKGCWRAPFSHRALVVTSLAWPDPTMQGLATRD